MIRWLWLTLFLVSFQAGSAEPASTEPPAAGTPVSASQDPSRDAPPTAVPRRTPPPAPSAAPTPKPIATPKPTPVEKPKPAAPARSPEGPTAKTPDPAPAKAVAETGPSGSMPGAWWLMAFAMLVTGFVAGFFWRHQMSRRKLGGMSVRIGTWRGIP